VFTLADLVRITGAKRRSLQLWADRGALKAEPETNTAGSGVHRQFSKDEAIIACILNGLALQEVAIGNLVKAANGIRSAYFRVPHLRETFEEALRGEGKNFLIYNLQSSITLWSQTHLKVTL
jgi:hypothetical protein